MTQGVAGEARSTVKSSDKPLSWKRKMTGIAEALRGLIQAIVSPGKPGDIPSGAPEEPALTPPPATEESTSTRGNPWTLSTLGDCSFTERVRKMDRLLSVLNKRSHVPYLRVSWVIRHLGRWAVEVVPGLDLQPGTESVCSSALDKIAQEIAEEIRNDPRQGRVIWIPSAAPGAVADIFGDPAKDAVAFVSSQQVLNRLRRWFFHVIPECATFDRLEKTACGRVVMEAAWEIAETTRKETRDGENVIWMPRAEVGELQEDGIPGESQGGPIRLK